MATDVYSFPVPEVAGAVGCAMIIFGGALGVDAGWNALALVLAGAALGGLAMIAQGVRLKRLQETP